MMKFAIAYMVSDDSYNILTFCNENERNEFFGKNMGLEKFKVEVNEREIIIDNIVCGGRGDECLASRMGKMKMGNAYAVKLKV